MVDDLLGLHADCAEDCCWPTVLSKAGGPTRINTEACRLLMERGYLQRSVSDEVSFDFSGLPIYFDPWLVAEAERLKQAWMSDPKKSSHVLPGSIRQLIKMLPTLDAAMGAAVVLGVRTSEGMAYWLGVEPRFMNWHWMRRHNVDYYIREGILSTPEIVKLAKAEWGMTLTRDFVAGRRRRLIPGFVESEKIRTAAYRVKETV